MGEAADWAASGAMALTGYADGPPLPAVGAPASAMRAALEAVALAAAVLDAAAGGRVDLPGCELLGERAALAGLTRRAPWSAGGAFRILPAADGWVGVSLPRACDVDAVPALTGRTADEPWSTLAHWLRSTPAAPAVERAALLGLALEAVPTAVRLRRPGVVSTSGGRLRGRERPLVVDLSSLWAGPLCAHLLGLVGADVVKVESRARPDGARRGNAAFFDLLHGGHRGAVLDLDTADGRHDLAALIRAADVVIEASRPRALRQWGLDAAESVAAGTIWVSITAYGRAPEDALRVGFGDDVAAGAGLVAWSDGVPLPAGDALADPLAGVHAAAAASEALRAGEARLIDVSMHDVAAAAARAPGDCATGSHDSTASPSSPRARTPRGRAPSLGEHTAEVLAQVGRARD